MKPANGRHQVTIPPCPIPLDVFVTDAGARLGGMTTIFPWAEADSTFSIGPVTGLIWYADGTLKLVDGLTSYLGTHVGPL